MLFVIEHLDPELYEWSLAEYEHITEALGKENVQFTNVKDCSKIDFATCKNKPIRELNPDKPCILDPEAEKTLEPSDKEKFETFIFGGVLGNDPPEKRTEDLLSKPSGFERRNLGKRQMSTDTAAIVAWRILQEEKKLSELKFIDDPEIDVEENLSTTMPYRYLDDGTGKPLICKKVMKLIKKGW